MKRLQKARERADELQREHSRLTGERGALQNQVRDIEVKCKADFECEPSALPELVNRLKSESETAITNAEIILGMRTGTVQRIVETPAPTPAPRSTPLASASKVIRTQTARLALPVDEDRLV